MEKYIYITQRAKNASFVKGEISAPSLREAERDLQAREVPVLDIEKVSDDIRRRPGFKKKIVPKISLKEKIAFAQSMEQCQDIDMGLLAALDICREMALTPKFADVCKKMRDQVSEGATLYDAMRETEVFDPLVLGLVRAGEKSGFLSKSFNQIKGNYRRSADIKRKMIKLLTYPAVVILVAMLCIFFLMWKTVPTFVGLFATAKLELPLPTKILMGASNFTTHYPYLVFLGICAIGYAGMQIPVLYRKLPSTHKYILKIPVVGKLQKLLIQETFTRTMMNLLTAGLKILDALSLCRAVSTCYPYKGAIARAILSVSGGTPLMISLEDEKDIFGLIVVRTLGFGEKTGKTEKVLEPLSQVLGSEIMDTIDTLNTIVEPLLTLMIGSIVLLIMLALFIPIFTLPKLV
jgi:type II secretory pathway component PulF